MTVAGCTLTGREKFAASTGRGVSDDAKNLDDCLNDFLANFRTGYTLGILSLAASRALEDAVREACEEDWDGYGAQSVSVATYNNALCFLEHLPTTLPRPGVAVEPDGEISFEWYLEPRRLFSVSVGRTERLTYAGLFGKSEGYGVEFFTDEIPQRVVDYIARVYTSGSSQNA